MKRKADLCHILPQYYNMLQSGRRPRAFTAKKADIEQFYPHVNKIRLSINLKLSRLSINTSYMFYVYIHFMILVGLKMYLNDNLF